MRISRIMISGACVIGVILALAPMEAHATCTPSHHCYAILEQDSPPSAANTDGYINIYTTNLNAASPSNNFVDHEFWYLNDPANGTWVEVGVTDGVSNGFGVRDQDIYWADNRVSGGYHEHYPSVSWSLSTYYQVEVAYAGSNSWHVYFGGVLLGTSSSNPPGSSRILEAGIETTADGASDEAKGNLHWSTSNWGSPYLSWTPELANRIKITVSTYTHEGLHGTL